MVPPAVVVPCGNVYVLVNPKTPPFGAWQVSQANCDRCFSWTPPVQPWSVAVAVTRAVRCVATAGDAGAGAVATPRAGVSGAGPPHAAAASTSARTGERRRPAER